MWSAALKILKDNWRSLLVVVVLVGAGVWFGMSVTRHELDEQALAFSQERQQLTDDFNARERQWNAERLAAAGQYASDLKAALAAQQSWKQKADELTVRLTQQKTAHERELQALKEKLKDALKSDGPAYTGIGPGGLQLWREALGYNSNAGVASGDGLRQTAGSTAGDPPHAARPGGGLSPAGIVMFSGEYGKWCLTLRDQLQAVSDYYDNRKKE
ncbi:TPA: hypothetical protein ACNH1V_000330 [Citrobacter koseri]